MAFISVNIFFIKLPRLVSVLDERRVTNRTGGPSASKPRLRSRSYEDLERTLYNKIEKKSVLVHMYVYIIFENKDK